MSETERRIGPVSRRHAEGGRYSNRRHTQQPYTGPERRQNDGRRTAHGEDGGHITGMRRQADRDAFDQWALSQ